jgi:hypothetical protein
MPTLAVLGWWNAYGYYNHLRLKHLPKTDLSGLKLEFDSEYDQTLDGAGDIHDVRLLDHATVVSVSGTAATVQAGAGTAGFATVDGIWIERTGASSPAFR